MDMCVHVCFIYSMLHWRQAGYVGDPLAGVAFYCYIDAAFAVDSPKVSLAGMLLVIRGYSP